MLYTIMQKHIKSTTTDDVGSIINASDSTANDTDYRADVVDYKIRTITIRKYPIPRPNYSMYPISFIILYQSMPEWCVLPALLL